MWLENAGRVGDTIQGKISNTFAALALCDWIKCYVICDGKRHPSGLGGAEVATVLTDRSAPSPDPPQVLAAVGLSKTALHDLLGRNLPSNRIAAALKTAPQRLLDAEMGY